MLKFIGLAVLGMMLFSAAAPAAETPATAPTTRPWRQVVQDTLGEGAFDKKDEVYTITRPRGDLLVTQLDMGDIPAGAGLASTLHFFPCPCGKTNVVGQLCVVDYEISSVVDELRGQDRCRLHRADVPGREAAHVHDPPARAIGCAEPGQRHPEGAGVDGEADEVAVYRHGSGFTDAFDRVSWSGTPAAARWSKIDSVRSMHSCALRGDMVPTVTMSMSRSVFQT